MNERIKELESQCWVKVPCDFDMREGGLSTIRTVFDRQKFAELIIRECVATLEQHHPFTKDPEAYLYAISLIEEHFGVEE